MCHGCQERDKIIYELEEEKRQLRSQLHALLLQAVPSRKRRRGVGSATALRPGSVNADTTIQPEVDNKVEFDLPPTYKSATTDREEAYLGLTQACERLDISQERIKSAAACNSR
jgi:hypothetical protein